MIIEDKTLDKNFSELQAGTCFVMYSEYYMKLFIKYYDEHTNDANIYRDYAVNLKTGFAQPVQADEKVRVVTGKMIIG